jgi:hypothetical protein
VEELPYGQQAQVDFGQYILRTNDNQRKRVYFFCDDAGQIENEVRALS